MCGPLLMRYDGDVSFSPTMVSAEKPSLVKPSDSFRQVAQNTSISPAIPKNTHAMVISSQKTKCALSRIFKGLTMQEKALAIHPAANHEAEYHTFRLLSTASRGTADKGKSPPGHLPLIFRQKSQQSPPRPSVFVLCQ